ncbi:hypothetical protein [Baekduia sp. Peel2402]|uniref:hypothetical protein n=1 Tax=Baekduia sp. Peel2402 TaxID=3458296 RepID=UPI00403E4608
MLLATIIDTNAFLHVALYGVLGALGLVLAFSVALVGLDRAEDGEAQWLVLTVLGGAACVALLAVGVWAMTQK